MKTSNLVPERGHQGPTRRPRLWTRWAALALSGCLIFLSTGLIKFECKGVIGHRYVEEILQGAPLIDGHNDFAIWIRAFYHNHIYQDNFTETGTLFGQVDFPRLRMGRVRGQFWSAYVECPKTPNNYSDEAYHTIVHDTLQQIDLIHRMIHAFPAHLTAAFSANEVWKNFHRSETVSSLVGIEGLHQIGNSASILRLYHRLGVRYGSLTHSCHNRYADSEEPEHPLHDGISSAGEELLQEMNRLGMLIDLSHTSYKTMEDALRISTAPVIFSHSSSYTLCPHSRNVPDDILFKLRDNDGVVMVTFYPEYVLCDDPENASLIDVANHIEYIGELIGYRHVGIGSDFDGMSTGPKGLEDVGRYPALIKELHKRGLSDKDLKHIMGANVLRVLRAAENEAERRRHLHPLEDDVRPFFD